VTTTPRRFKLIVAYDGGPFAGWQSQVHGNTIQDHLERAIRKVSGESARVHGSGRTDTGVHALEQWAHFDLNKSRLSPSELQKALNATLPGTIRIFRCSIAPPTFHARFSVKSKAYRYRIWNAPVLPPAELGRAWHVTKPLNIMLMKSALARFVGRHDFAAFSANPGRKREETIRTITSARLTKKGACVAVEIEGDGFLYKMVRMIVGALVLHNEGKLALTEISRALDQASGNAQRLVAPASGLFLRRVRY
jgi:tRNA pseudouridine38-40 synthase